jgi:hypothetical protein
VNVICSRKDSVSHALDARSFFRLFEGATSYRYPIPTPIHEKKSEFLFRDIANVPNLKVKKKLFYHIKEAVYTKEVIVIE